MRKNVRQPQGGKRVRSGRRTRGEGRKGAERAEDERRDGRVRSGRRTRGGTERCGADEVSG